MLFKQMIETDIPILKKWIRLDSFHKDSPVENWYSIDEYCLIASWVYDDEGPVLFFRLDIEGENIRLNTQFGPEDEISRKRQAVAIVDVFPKLVELTNIPGAKGIVFWSISSDLIRFMKNMGFEDWKENEFIYKFQVDK